MKHIICITSKINGIEDPHLGLVKKKVDNLTSGKVKIFVVDPFKYPIKPYSYNIRPTKNLNINYEDTTLSKKNIGVVWYRKPFYKSRKDISGSIQKNTNAGKEYLNFAETAYDQYTKLFLGAFQDLPWVSNYWNIMRANNRVYNLEVAKEVGFSIPKTIITSSSKDAYNFYCKNKEKVVSKTLRLSTTTVNKKHLLMYAQKLKEGLNQDFFIGLDYAPAIFQQHVNKVSDIRVTVVGDKVLAGEIISKDMDWRKGNYKGGYQIKKHQLPKDIERKCVQITKKMGLEYSAIDLGRISKNKYTYFENNPNGQWAFVENLSTLDISGEMARLLISKLKN